MTVYYEVYNPQGVLVETGVMVEEVAGVYRKDVTFKPEWGTGFFLVRCWSDVDATEDVMTVWVVSEAEYPLKTGEFRPFSQYIYATL